MLRLLSFEMTDSAGMNIALQKHVLSKGASVFVSEGKIVLQMEDGLPMTSAQKLVAEKEARESVALTLGPIEHSQSVLDIQMAEVKAQIETLETTIKQAKEKASKMTGEERQKLEGKLKNLKNVYAQFESQHNINKAEIDQVNVNLKVFDAKIAELEKLA